MRARLGVWMAASFLLGFSVAVRAEPSAPKPPANDDCFACHGDASSKRADGTLVAVDAKRFEASKHGPMACVDCHQDLASLKEFPHANKLARVDCASCHDEPVKKYAAGVHAQARNHGKTLAATCADCHGTHDIQGAREASSPTNHLNLPGTCAKCHGNADIIRRGHIQVGDVASLYHDSIHGKALEKSGLVVAPSCVDCHGSHDILRKTDPASRVWRANVPVTCGTCHDGIRQHYDAGSTPRR